MRYNVVVFFKSMTPTTKKVKKSAYVHARIDSDLKSDGLRVLEDLGLSISEFIKFSFHQLARDKAVQFELKMMADDKEGRYTKVASVDHAKKLIAFDE